MRRPVVVAAVVLVDDQPGQLGTVEFVKDVVDPIEARVAAAARSVGARTNRSRQRNLQGKRVCG